MTRKLNEATIYGCFLFMVFCAVFSVNSQNPYTVVKYKDTVFTNISYGRDTGFAGELVDLKLDIYKPINDSNCRRPLLVVVHGGAWIGGDKSGGFLPTLCHAFSQRGYVVASINYRMGFHKLAYYVPYAVCPSDKCLYTYDSAEVIRANFRGMQDAKAAIRFMKNRFLMDSTDPNNTYLLGESAGAFISYATAYLDQNTEKPTVCGAMPTVPTPDSDLSYCLPNNPKFTRPDLGDINGRLNLNGLDASVKSVACFYGGVFDLNIFKNKALADTPALYLFHQTCDVVVDNNRSKLLSKLYTYCLNPLNLCQPLTTMPPAFGSTQIKNYLDTVKYKKPFFQYTLLTAGGAYSCDVNSNCHGVDNVQSRAKEVAELNARIIKSTGNKPGMDLCYSAIKENKNVKIGIYPNPADQILTISFQRNPLPQTEVEMYNQAGKLILSQTTDFSGKMDVSNLSDGMYYLFIPKFNSGKTIQIKK